MGAQSNGRVVARFLPVGAALFCVQLDFFSLSLALPSIAADLGTSTTNLQWLLSGYMIAVGALLIPGGRLGDMLGRRAVLLVGIALFGATSSVCGLVSSIPVLIAARVAQGAAAAMILPSAFAVVTNATDEAVRPRVVGTLIGIGGVGTGYSLGELAVQSTLPPERSAEGTSVLLTVLTAVGGLGVVVATAVIEALGDQQITSGGISVALVAVAALLLVAGLATWRLERRPARRRAPAVPAS